ncbi:Mu transposase C-terminal domain-containing protein [Neobacillus novalis]|uniref:Mu transposase C-terminal domain-containing protein n=1 Tax=Neobacillus novalis TaxID=220687 RepID=A0AA95MJ78_9BACI|nr:Mu transposase C-terminal domain-containing protein [Neobacillus novalis]WHY84676.1 Mu transposase C-terminal domain-containing protein [Neobacillus novalis]
MRIYVGIGTKYVHLNRSFEITEEIEPNVFLTKDLEFESLKNKVTITDIYNWMEEGVLELQNQNEKQKKTFDFSDFSMLPIEQQEGAKFRHFVIEPLLVVSDNTLKPYIKGRIEQLEKLGHKVSEKSIYRWLGAFLESDGDIRSLVSNKHNSAPKEKRLHTEVELIIEQVLNISYKRRELANPKKVHYEVVNEIHNRNKENEANEKLPYPSISTIRRRITDSDSYERDKVRLGHEATRKKFASAMLLQPANRPLQRVEVDHTKLDLILLDDNDYPLGRPTLTTAFDKFTGNLLGFYVGFEPPSYVSVMNCLLHASSPKTYIKKLYPSVKNEWLAFGLPEFLVVDRGKEFTSKHIIDACLKLDINLEFTKARSTWKKGIVERYFRTLNEGLIHQLPGTTFSNILKKGDYDPEKNAVMHLNSFLELLHIYIVDVYSQKPRSLNRPAPTKMWKKAMENGFTPSIPSTKLDWKVALMKIGTSSIQNTGIRKAHLFYQSKELSELKIRLVMKGKGTKVTYKYDPSDISKVYVYNEFDKDYLEVFCTNQEYSQNLSEYAHQLFVDETREEEKASFKIGEIDEAIAKIVQKAQEEIQSKKDRQKQARMEQNSSTAIIGKVKKGTIAVTFEKKRKERKW